MIFLANLLTTLSLLSGFVSIIFSLESHFTFASWAIIISVIFDGLDGQVARKNPVQSDFGKELDSLVDVVSFGVAPSVLGYIFVYRHFHLSTFIALFLYLTSSVMRLAKYNVTAKETTDNYFLGLPTTVSGGAIASFILLYRKHTQSPQPFVFLLIVLVLAFLMVSKVKYPNLDGLKEALGRKKLLFLIISAIALAFAPEFTVFFLFLIYLLFSSFMVKSKNTVA